MCTCSMVSEIDYLIQKLIFHGYFNEYVSWQLTRYKHLFKSTPVQQKHWTLDTPVLQAKNRQNKKDLCKLISPGSRSMNQTPVVRKCYAP